MDKYIGKKLDGRYEIEELIGSGGMANVYRAHDVLEDRPVAVKILKDEYISNMEFVRRFRNESKAIAVLNHPNIVKVYDVIFSDTMQSIVMEHIDGVTLKDYIEEQGVLKWKEAVYFTVQILRALQHAHDKGIVHRDIKPQNIMLLYDGTIKVTDFGIARFSRSETKTLTDRAIGSVHYISPEQARGESTDARADIYSVGVMLFEMLTGQLPFEADSPVSVAIKQIQSEPKRPRQLNPDIPEGLEEITIRAMQKDVQKRYQSAAEMLRDIDEFKRNPAISFEYKYMDAERPAEIPRAALRAKAAMNKTPPKRAAKPAGRPAVPRGRHEADTGEEVIVEKKTPFIPILAGVAAAFVLVAGLFIFWMFYTNNPFQVVESTDLPTLVGMRYESVKNNPLYSGFKIVIEERDFNDEYERGIIYDQQPKGTRQVKVGSTIKVWVSNGEKSIEMEDYSGREATEVLSTLYGLGLKPVESKLYHPTVQKGYVIRTDPPKGSEVNEGDEITVYISMGAETTLVEVPDLTELDLNAAKMTLSALGLKVGTVDTQMSDLPEGTILSQDPAYKDQVEKGTAINIVVSGGDTEYVTIPITISLPKSDKTVKVAAYLDDRLVKEQTITLSDVDSWTASFRGTTEDAVVEFQIDGKLYMAYDIDFYYEEYNLVIDNSEDFVV